MRSRGMGNPMLGCPDVSDSRFLCGVFAVTWRRGHWHRLPQQQVCDQHGPTDALVMVIERVSEARDPRFGWLLVDVAGFPCLGVCRSPAHRAWVFAPVRERLEIHGERAQSSPVRVVRHGAQGQHRVRARIGPSALMSTDRQHSSLLKGHMQFHSSRGVSGPFHRFVAAQLPSVP